MPAHTDCIHPPSEVGVEPAVQSAVREVKTGSHAAPETMGNAEREREKFLLRSFVCIFIKI